MRHFIIDTDTASDDAVALVMALNQPDIDVKAITVVSGNLVLEQAIQNALYTVEICRKRVPVYAGCGKPILQSLSTATQVHGHDGMGDIGLQLSGRTPAEGHAVDVIRDLIDRYSGDITLVTIGPLTNIAVALLCDPSLAQKVSRCIVMGGVGSGHGNVTPLAEFNIWVDPEAAKIVFESGLPITMVGWDASRNYGIFDTTQVAELRTIGTPLAQFVTDIQAMSVEHAHSETKLVGFDLPDPIAMAVAIDSGLAETKRYRVDVITGCGMARGQTVVDVLGMTKLTPNVDVVTWINRERFVRLLANSLR